MADKDDKRALWEADPTNDLADIIKSITGGAIGWQDILNVAGMTSEDFRAWRGAGADADDAPPLEPVIGQTEQFTIEVDPVTGQILGATPVTGRPVEPTLGDTSGSGRGGFLSLSGATLPSDFALTGERPIGRDYLERKYKLPSGQVESVAVTPRYRDGDMWGTPDQVPFANWNSNDITAIQYDMVMAGLLGIDEFTPGYYDQSTAKGMGYLMALANTRLDPNQPDQAMTWRQALGELLANPLPEFEKSSGVGSARVPTPYLAPDYASISQDVKAMFRQALGREPRDWEMAILADQVGRDHRAAWQVAEDIAKAGQGVGGDSGVLRELEEPIPEPDYLERKYGLTTTKRAPEGFSLVQRRTADGQLKTFTVPGDVPNAGGNHFVSGAGFEGQAVDEVSRLRERFEKMIAGELANREMSADVRNNVQSVINSAAGLSNLIGGR